MPVYSLDTDKLEFPNPNLADDTLNGLLAIGGDLSVKRLLSAYKNGIFPWFNEDDPILWWSPNPRAILIPDEFRINRTFRKILNKQQFELKINTDFKSVIRQCANPRKDSPGTWLSPEMQQAYLNLYQTGLAHSYECWQDNHLVGGLYGVRLGSVFFAESMFHLVNNSSKMAVYFLTQEMLKTKGTLIDIQIMSPHLQNWGAKEITRYKFLSLLQSQIR